MTRRVTFQHAAQADLISLYEYIGERSGVARARAYVDRIEAACLALADYPERGTLRDDLRPGMRVIGFERRVAIVFSVESDGTVRIGRIVYGGRDLAALAFDPE